MLCHANSDKVKENLPDALKLTTNWNYIIHHEALQSSEWLAKCVSTKISGLPPGEFVKYFVHMYVARGSHIYPLGRISLFNFILCEWLKSNKDPTIKTKYLTMHFLFLYFENVKNDVVTKTFEIR